MIDLKSETQRWLRENGFAEAPWPAKAEKLGIPVPVLFAWMTKPGRDLSFRNATRVLETLGYDLRLADPRQRAMLEEFAKAGIGQRIPTSGAVSITGDIVPIPKPVDAPVPYLAIREMLRGSEIHRHVSALVCPFGFECFSAASVLLMCDSKRFDEAETGWTVFRSRAGRARMGNIISRLYLGIVRTTWLVQFPGEFPSEISSRQFRPEQRLVTAMYVPGLLENQPEIQNWLQAEFGHRKKASVSKEM